jgi:hypothetical protein
MAAAETAAIRIPGEPGFRGLFLPISINYNNL